MKIFTEINLEFEIKFAGFSVGSNLWLSEWSNQAEKLNSNSTDLTQLYQDSNYYFRIYLVFGLLQGTEF